MPVSSPQFRKISILGCGWLGFPLALELKRRGHLVKGSTTTAVKLAKLQVAGIEPYLLDVAADLETPNSTGLFIADVLIITLPFKRDFDPPDLYTRQIEALIARIESSTIRFVIFTSSTSVYPDNIGVAREETAFVGDNPRALVLREVEQRFLANKHFGATVCRLGGLYGPDRPIGRFLSGQRDVPDPDQPVNLVHLADCVGAIAGLVQRPAAGEIFNICADEHPSRRELYTRAALAMGLPAPQFRGNSSTPGKIVSNNKIKKYLPYQFVYPDPWNFNYDRTA